jgi:ribosomal protein S18 acetylase RimI-like enzyme
LNAKILYLTVNKNNTKAINAYYRAGFYLENEVVNDIGNGYVMDDYVLAFKL